MIFCHFVGRVGKDAKVINGTHGDFLTMDVAEDFYYAGENHTRWIRVRSNQPNLINNAKYYTKGKPLLIEGALMEPTIWTDKSEQPHIQLIVSAQSINFMPLGKKREEDGETAQNAQAQNPAEENNQGMPFEAPQDNAEDLPF